MIILFRIQLTNQPTTIGAQHMHPVRPPTFAKHQYVAVLNIASNVGYSCGVKGVVHGIGVGSKLSVISLPHPSRHIYSALVRGP